MAGLDESLNGTASLAAVFLLLTTATIGLRFLARYRQKAGVGPDDYAALASWIGFVGIDALFIYGMTHHFIGYHKPSNPAIQKAQHPMMERVFLSLNILEVWAFGTVKLSALFFYRRLFCTRAKPGHVLSYITWALIAVVAAWIVTFAIMTFNICGKHNTIEWTVIKGRTKECQLNYPYFRGVSISDFILDVVIVSLAFPMIWSLSMTKARKVAVTGVFLLALGGVGASCARMVEYNLSVNAGRSANDKDEYRVNTQRQYYAVLEGGLGIVSVNLPSIWYFVSGLTATKVFDSVRGMLSLDSMRSRSSRTTSKTASEKTSLQDATRTSSEAWIVSQVADVERQSPALKASDKIHVQQSYEVRSLHG